MRSMARRMRIRAAREHVSLALLILGTLLALVGSALAVWSAFSFSKELVVSSITAGLAGLVLCLCGVLFE